MTFTEAAAHVLRLVGKPLHYKEITDVAIERDLLSHVGKSPEVTMGARLAAVVKKDPKDNPLVRVKPGVFALRDWDQSLIDTGLADRTPALERLAKLQVERGGEIAAPAAVSSVTADTDDGEAEGYPELGGLDADEDEELGEDERARAELAAAATELFVPEEDDDEPILGGPEPEQEAGEGPDRGDGSGKRRRRRRRRGRGGLDEEGGLPSYTVSDAPLLADSEEEEPSSSGTRAEPSRRGFEARGGDGRQEGARSDRNGEARSFDRFGEGGERSSESRGEGRQREGRDRDRGEGRDRDRSEGREREGREREGREREGRGEGREREGREREGRGELRAVDARAPEGGRSVDDLAAPSVLALLEQLLGPRSRSGPMPVRQLAEQGVRRVRAKVEMQALQDAIGDAVRAEVARARIERRRPRFVLSARGVSSTDWGLDAEVVRLERELANLVTRHRDAFARSFGERLQQLPPRALGDFVTLLLSQIGFEEIQPIRRQGAHNQEMHFAAIARSATGDLPTAIIVRRDGRDLGRERVIDLRGALHHYEGAQAGLLMTTGQVMSGAREEARAPNAAPVTLYDGVSLAKLACQHGVGVSFAELRLPMVDADLFDSLASG